MITSDFIFYDLNEFDYEEFQSPIDNPLKCLKHRQNVR